MTTGSEFASKYAKAGPWTFEPAARDVAAAAQSFGGVLVPVTVHANGHEATYLVSNDYFRIGGDGDALRLPLSALGAQRVLDALGGYLLPTTKMVDDIWKAAPAKIEPITMVNKPANMPQFAAHNRAVDEAFGALGLAPDALRGGAKKDVVLTNARRPGTVAIYGWHHLDGRQTQKLNAVDHDDRYSDYSHGVRLVAPFMVVDGQQRRTADVLQDRELSALLSSEGPIRALRYDPVGMGAPIAQTTPAAVPAGYDPGPAPGQVLPARAGSGRVLAGFFAVLGGLAIVARVARRRV